MDQGYLHFIFNHFPILGTLFGVITLSIGLMKRDNSLEDAGLLTFFVSGMLAIPAYLSGEAAEEMIEELPEISHSIIHEHEELAEKAILVMILLAVISLSVFLFSKLKKRNLRAFKLTILVFSIFAFVLMVFVGKTGGEIRHSEIRNTK